MRLCDKLAAIHAETGVMIQAEDYVAAADLLEANTQGLVRNTSVEPNWIADTEQFWYRRESKFGPEYILVNTLEGTKEPAFDHERLADAISAATGKAVAANDLDFTELEFSRDSRQLSGQLAGQVIQCDLETMKCSAQPIPKPGTPGVQSTSGRYCASVSDDNLYLEDLQTDDRRQLTFDGEQGFSYGKVPDCALVAIDSNEAPKAPYGAAFSPDERFLIVPRIDERAITLSPFVEWAPRDGSIRPVVHQVRTPITGEVGTCVSQFYGFDIKSNQCVEFNLPAGMGTGQFDQPIVGWSRSRAEVFMFLRDFGSRRVSLFAINLTSGAVREVIREEARTRVELNANMDVAPNVRILGDGEEVIWYSCRTGWGHLYLFDALRGTLKRALTFGNWAVHDIFEVDEERREIYMTAGGREPDRDPYFRHLYRVHLDIDDVVLLTQEDADHHFDPPRSEIYSQLHGTKERYLQLIRPDLEVFVDTHSTVDKPPVTHLRSTRDGRTLAKLEEADASALYAAGWQPPVRKRVTAADGETDIYAVYYRPLRTLPSGRHPVIDAVYGGAQVAVAPRNFVQAYRGINPYGQSAFARLGFAVVTIDGRGTPHRSQAFRDAGYPEFTRVGIEDHVTAIHQLAERYPEMDIKQVGVYGWSWGGTFSAQALLTQPDFYRVAVAGTGVYDYSAMGPFYENYISPPDYGDGRSSPTSGDQKPVNWAPLDITQMASNLQGKLLLISAELDENVPPNQAVRLIRALIEAGKPYDYLYLPNCTHYTGFGPQLAYTQQRTMDYFVEHLMGAKPPDEVTIEYGRGLSF